MAVRVITKKHTFGANGTALLSSILGRSAKTWIGSLAIRCARLNAADVFWCDDGGELGGFIGPAEAVTFDFGEGQTLVMDFLLHGTTNDIIYLTVGINSNHTDPYVMLNG